MLIWCDPTHKSETKLENMWITNLFLEAHQQYVLDVALNTADLTIQFYNRNSQNLKRVSYKGHIKNILKGLQEALLQSFPAELRH